MRITRKIAINSRKDCACQWTLFEGRFYLSAHKLTTNKHQFFVFTLPKIFLLSMRHLDAHLFIYIIVYLLHLKKSLELYTN